MMRSALKTLMSTLFLLGSAQGFAANAAAPDPAQPFWMRAPAISPDGKTIAFTYRGRIYAVDAAGGDARPLTDPQFRSTDPIWSPDGKTIAFSSAVSNIGDVYALPLDGGEIRRLTYNELMDLPVTFTPDGKNVVTFAAGIGTMEANFLDGENGFFSGTTHSVPVGGGRERIFMPIPTKQASISPDGNLVAYAFSRTVESVYRKRQISDGTSDIWIFDRKTGKHRQLTHHRSNEKSPVFSADGKFVYFTSEMPEGGEKNIDAKPVSTNVWKMAVDGKSAPEQVTYHDALAVRGLSISHDGTLSYSYDGEIWKVPPGQKPEKVAIRVGQGILSAGPVPKSFNDQVSEIAVSPDASEIALIARGDVFVVQAATGTTRRITATPQAERSVSFSPDGRSLLYASDRKTDWDLFESKIVRKDDTGFVDAADIKETVLLDTDTDLLQPLYSPKGDKVAYRDGRNALRVLDIATGKTIEVLPDNVSYSYEEGDLSHAWSPDGKYLTTATGLTIFNSEILVIDAATGARSNVSLNGFPDQTPMFSRDGSMIYWQSQRFALRQMDDQTSMADVVATFLSLEAAKAFASGAPLKAGPVNLDGASDRTKRLTGMTQNIAFADLSADAKTLNIIAVSPAGTLVGYAFDTHTGAARQIFQHAYTGNEHYAVDAAGKTFFISGAGQIDAYDLATGTARAIAFDTTAPHDFRGEMNYLFEHQWRLVQSKFYDKAMHGVDWQKMHDVYAKYVPHIAHWEDFAELMGELQGELNSSHMFSDFHPDSPTWDRVGALGVYYDMAYEGPGVKIAGVLKGGPADEPGSLIVPGAIIQTVDGVAIAPDAEIAPLLNFKIGKPVLLGVVGPDAKAAKEQKVIPVTVKEEATLAYQRWVQQRREMVERLSGGRLGYVHVAAMNDAEMRKTYSELMGRYEKAEAAIIDVRFNTGGFLHDQLVTFLTGTRHSGLVTRNGADFGLSPYDRWARPTALLQNAFTYSDGSIFPFYYKRQALGPIIGDGVPGTGTAVLDVPQIEPRLTFAVAQIGFRTKEGVFFENTEIVPDVAVPTEPNFISEGRDPQTEAAVKALLAVIDAGK